MRKAHSEGLKSLDLKELQKSYDISDFIRDAKPILESARVAHMNAYVQHGTTSTLDHTMAVAYCSVAYARQNEIVCDEASLLRGALLHDYFLYDWHEAGDGSHRLHGFRHPQRALANAQHDFDLNDIECDIIAHHMFPLVPVRPSTVEGRIVGRIDKRCSLRETRNEVPYPEFGAEGPAAMAGISSVSTLLPASAAAEVVSGVECCHA